MVLGLICQRYELKANHNSDQHDIDWRFVGINMSKIRIESKSQLNVEKGY